MGNWRVWVGGVLLVGLLWWLHPKPGHERGADVTEVTIWFNGIIEGRHIDVIDAFERRFPEYRGLLGSSAVRTGLEGEGNPQRLMCGIAGGVPPEVVEYDRFAVCQWAARGAFLDLGPLIQRDQQALQAARSKLADLQGREAPADELARQTEHVAHLEKYAVRAEDYYPTPWDECTYQGGLYGIPNYMDDRVLYFNSDMLVQAGLVDAEGRPRPPDTWEQIVRKRVQVSDATIEGFTVRTTSADFAAAGVRSGDSLSHISSDGRVTRCLVDAVVGPQELTVRSAYTGRDLRLPQDTGQQIKVFDQDSYALRLSRWDDDGRLQAVGYEPQHGNGWLFHYGWMNGGEFMSPDGRTCTLNDPRIVEALEFTTDVYDAQGGVSDVNAFKKSFQAYAQDPFFQNQVAMFINGDWFLRDLARWKRDMHFGTYPPPMPENQVAAGNRYCTWVGGFAWCLPSTCPEEKREAAWWLIKFLASPEGGMIMNEHDAQRERGQGRLYMPRLMASRVLSDRQLGEYVNIPEMPTRIREAIATHLQLLDFARHRPVSPEGHKLWNAQADAQDLAWNHGATPREALDLHTGKVQRALDKFHSPPAGPPIRWTYLVYAYLAALLGAGALIWWRHAARYRTTPGYQRREWYAGTAFALPWLAGFVVLAGGPMLFSAVMSVAQYDVINPAILVGAENYREMFTTDWGNVGGVRQALGNTVFMALGLPVGMAVGLGLALLLNARVRGMSLYRTTFFLPAIMPVVAASVLWIWVFNAQNGMMNWLLQLSGLESLLDGLGIRTPISWLTNKSTSKPALIIMGLWGAGASMIIWLAGLKEIPTHLYEAAALDGAGPIRRFFTVTLPMLSPYILFNLVLGLIGTFQVFTQAYIMTPNGSPERSTYFYVYKLFDECFSYFKLGYGAAMAWVLFGIVILLTAVNMKLSKRWVHYGGE